MKPAGICLAFAVLAACGFSGHAACQEKPSQIGSADRLFETGKFAEAGQR